MNNIKQAGPGLWHIIHYSALIADHKIAGVRMNRETFYEIVQCAISCIGCSHCKSHARHEFKQIKSISNLFEYTVNIHNKVNSRLHKSSIHIDAAKKEHKIPRRRSIYTPGINDFINYANNTSQYTLYSIMLNLFQ